MKRRYVPEALGRKRNGDTSEEKSTAVGNIIEGKLEKENIKKRSHKLDYYLLSNISETCQLILLIIFRSF